MPQRVLPPWSKCCDLVSSFLKRKFLHKLWSFLTEICLWCCQSKTASALFCSCFQPNCVLMYRAGQILRKLSVLPWPLCRPSRWRQGSCCWWAVRWKLGQEYDWQSLLPPQNSGECRGWREISFPCSALKQLQGASSILHRFPRACAVSLKFWERPFMKEGRKVRN